MINEILGASSGADLTKIMEAHKAIRRQTEFVMDNRIETVSNIAGKHKKLITSTVDVFDSVVKAFTDKGYDHGEATKAAGLLVQSPWFATLFSSGI